MLLKHGFETVTLSYQGHRIIPPSIVLEIFLENLRREGFSYQLGNA